MRRFFFDITDTGEVYHDARGATLPGSASAKERAFDIVRKLMTGPLRTEHCDLGCTVRDVDGNQLMQIRIAFGMPETTNDPNLADAV
ncbi:DUF6894 family protein [Mesorhizobium sp. B1-1-8]|uniref:DUF6894 family protein n=1 Tax=Mesorhizobium sp. B1-1-8 TaxID=2589976 RepID=UPI0011278172|nr:hypothetical protein [Mesorhizobium sp. B1-1-8]UCI10677.1 hypothetical protein FJ974_28310 [Mesorhizobium sp. B1-1-8]